MRILLISSNRFKYPWPIVPYGTIMVAQAVESAGHQVKVLDTCYSSTCAADVVAAIKEYAPDVIGLSVRNIDTCAGEGTKFLLEEQKEVADACKRSFAGPIIVGGAAMAINGEEILEYLDLTYGACGDGERVLVDFLDRLRRNEPLHGMLGLIIRENGVITQKKTAAFVADIEQLELPNPGKYIDVREYYKFQDSIQVQTKRGCALKCSYCPYPQIEGSEYRYYSPRKIADHIEKMVRETGLKTVEFIDSSVNIPSKHFKEVLREIIKKNLGLRLQSMIGFNPGGIDAEMVQLMKEAGFTDISLGIDSASDVVLKGLRKNYSKRQMRNAAELLRAQKITVTWYLLLGSPEESKDTLKETFDFIDEAVSSWEAVIIAVGVRVYNHAEMAVQIRERNPGDAQANFLYPYVVRPEKLDLASVLLLVKLYSLYRDNVIVYGFDTTPVWVVKMGFLFVKTFRPSMATIQMHVLENRMRKWMGQLFFKRLKFKISNRHALKRLGVHSYPKLAAPAEKQKLLLDR